MRASFFFEFLLRPSLLPLAANSTSYFIAFNMDERAATTIDGSRITQVLIWFLFLAAVLGAGARLATKWAMSRKLFLDDVLIIAAQVRTTKLPPPCFY